MSKSDQSRREELVLSLHRPELSSAALARALSTELGYACSEWMTYDIRARLGLTMSEPAHKRRGASNPGWRCGRSVNKAGYAYVPAPPNHPHRRQAGNMLEHRLVMESTLGRYLLPTEVVDHIDRLTLHNAPENLRLFVDSAAHLRATYPVGGPVRSASGCSNGRGGNRRQIGLTPVHICRQREARGDSRLRQCIQIVLKFGADHPFALGTKVWLEQIGIDPASRHSLELAWIDLENRYAQDLRL